MSTNPLLKVNNLVKTYPIKKSGTAGESLFTALRNIDFHLKPAEILGILGPNGEVKLPLYRFCWVFLKPTSGTITYFGKNFFAHRSEILGSVSYASSYAKLPPQLTVYENLDIYAELYGIPKNERAYRILKYLTIFGMEENAQKETLYLSAGQMTRVMLAKAFMSQPRIILLDEPTASLDPDIAYDVRAFIKEQQHEQGLSIIVTSHNMDEVADLCDRALVLKKGQIIANDTPNNLALSIQQTRLHLTADNPENIYQFMHEQDLAPSRENHTVSCAIEEKNIAPFFIKLAQAGIMYSQIAIDKPTLEDYFLSIAREKKNI